MYISRNQLITIEKEKNKGITLIALIITIIIMLILAGIVINLTIGEKGIIKKAQEAGIQYAQETAREKLNLALLDLDSKKLSEQGRHLQLEELLEIEDDSIDIQVTSDEKVKIFSEEGKSAKYAIAIVDGYQFKIYENLELELIGKRKEESEDNVFGYIQEGLIVLYDGKNNTGNGHSDVTDIWKNLAPISEENIEGQNDGTLMNIDFTNSSGWTDNSLVLDGVDDWVKMSYLHYENMTVEIVAKPLDITTKSQCYICNYQTGGMGISKVNSGYTKGQAYIGGEYKFAISNKSTMIGQIYSMSTGYNGNILYFRENEDMYQTQTTGSYMQPANSTIFAIGTNPNGTTENIPSGESRFNIEVYSVRIYNRCLTEEEIKHNFEIDKQRFEI